MYFSLIVEVFRLFNEHLKIPTKQQLITDIELEGLEFWDGLVINSVRVGNIAKGRVGLGTACIGSSFHSHYKTPVNKIYLLIQL